MAVTLIGYSKQGPMIGTLRVSCSVEEMHSKTNEITEHPIESGLGVADNIKKNQDTLEMHGIISDACMTPIEAIAKGIKAAESLGFAGTPGPSNPTPTFTIADAYVQLSEMCESKSIFKVVTGLRAYENMAFESFVVRRDASTGRVLDFRARMRQVEFVFATRIPVRSQQRASAPKAMATKPAAGDDKVIPNDPMVEQIQSPTRRIGQALGLEPKLPGAQTDIQKLFHIHPVAP